jgi:hypothetical protein
MAKYCDTKKLEDNWFHWIIASAVPDLEPHRKTGSLWTKILAVVPDTNRLDPNHTTRSHCIITPAKGRDGELVVGCLNSYDGAIGDRVTVFTAGRPSSAPLPAQRSLPASEALVRAEEILKAKGYIKERPVQETWHKIFTDIDRMCRGIVMKFNLDEVSRADLASEALVQLSNKINSRKITYTPGRAPVFNLLTTTIYRVMCSILNKDTKHKRNIMKLAMEKGANQLCTV